jgi:hypothetical protein
MSAFRPSFTFFVCVHRRVFPLAFSFRYLHAGFWSILLAVALLATAGHRPPK